MPGGGVALLNAVEALDAVEKGLEGDVLTGVKLLRKALPADEHAGRERRLRWRRNLESVKREQKAKKNKHIGFDVMAEDYPDMIKRQIIDPAKVTRGGLEMLPPSQP